MKKHFLVLLSILLAANTYIFAQVTSGEYGTLNLVQCTNKTIKGYYENYTGEDGKFSCIFYFEATPSGKEFIVTSFYPKDEKEESIKGKLIVENSTTIKIKLDEEHGGCWNVEHFADDFINFGLTKKQTWIDLLRAKKDKCYFYTTPKESAKGKGYIIKNDLVYVEKIQGNWAYCTFFGKKTTKGWLKLDELK